MKKLVICFLSILLIIFIAISYMVHNNDYNVSKIKRKIEKNTEIRDISYLNEYDNYYLVMDNDYLYVIDKEYKIILKKEQYLLYENKKNYDIIYKDDTLMYMNNYIKKDNLICEYYDIFTYELIKRVIVGGSYEQYS